MQSNIMLYTLSFPLDVNGEDIPLEVVEYYHDDNEAVVMGNLIAQLINRPRYIVTNETTAKTNDYQTIWNRKQEGQAVLAEGSPTRT